MEGRVDGKRKRRITVKGGGKTVGGEKRIGGDERTAWREET